MKIALFPNIAKRQSTSIAIGIREYLIQRGVSVVADDRDAIALGATPLSNTDLSEIDICITLGGDGTILRFIHNYPDLQAPILGVNLGGLGFMADIPLTDVYPCLQEILKGNYIIEKRMMMEGVSPIGKTSYALNEVVIHRAQNPCLIELAIHVDGNYLNTFAADGIIIATPSGSTAYSLAAGGPIITPELEAFVLTPICPHTVSNRPIVLMPSINVQIQYISDHDPVEIAFDGIDNYNLASGEMLYIRRSERLFKLVNLPQFDYYSTLRKKLGWTGKLKA